jgi:hypothetical protein
MTITPCREWIESPDDDRSIHLSERQDRDSRTPRSVTNAGGVDGDRKRRKPNGLGQITPLLARSPDGSLSLKIGSRLGSRHSHAAFWTGPASTAPLADVLGVGWGGFSLVACPSRGPSPYRPGVIGHVSSRLPNSISGALCHPQSVGDSFGTSALRRVA